MTLYVDASIVLRVALAQRDALDGVTLAEPLLTSVLTELECLRTLDRLFVNGALDADGVAERRQAVFGLLDATETVPLVDQILRRAADPYPTPLGTLDALHLATALEWSERGGMFTKFATHDRELGRAARACGLSVLGV